VFLNTLLSGTAIAASARSAPAAFSSPRRGDALLIVDVQRDFLPGGALAPEGAHAVLQGLALQSARPAPCVLPARLVDRERDLPGISR
jgi:hypothetical protein